MKTLLAVSNVLGGVFSFFIFNMLGTNEFVFPWLPTSLIFFTSVIGFSKRGLIRLYFIFLFCTLC